MRPRRASEVNSSAPFKPICPVLKPAPPFLFRSWDAAEPTDRNLFRSANAQMSWAAISRHVIFRRALGWIYKFPFQVAPQFRAHAGKTRAALGRDYGGQLRDLLVLAASTAMSPEDYYQLGLARFRGGRELRDFVSHNFYLAPASILIRRRMAATGRERGFGSKIEFERRFRDLGFACVQTVAMVTPDDTLGIDGKPGVIDPPTGDLFVKPDRAGQGFGTAVFRFLGPGRYRGGDGEEFTLAQLFGKVRETAAENDWYSYHAPLSDLTSAEQRMLVQVALRNHPEISARAGEALATARIITLRDEDDNPEIVFGAFRTAGARNAIVDNFHARGVAFPIDIRTGTLGAGRILNFYDDPRFHADHPVTGARMEGWRLPQWQSAAQLALDLHRSVPEIFHAGWDIAFTPSGPCVLEVNSPPGLPIVQMQRGFLGTRYSQLMAHHLAQWLDGAAR